MIKKIIKLIQDKTILMMMHNRKFLIIQKLFRTNRLIPKISKFLKFKITIQKNFILKKKIIQLKWMIKIYLNNKMSRSNLMLKMKNLLKQTIMKKCIKIIFSKMEALKTNKISISLIRKIQLIIAIQDIRHKILIKRIKEIKDKFIKLIYFFKRKQFKINSKINKCLN